MAMSTRTRNPFHEWVRLEQPRLGTRVVDANDEFFGAKERLIEPSDPVFIPDKYDDHGKWMDGWETRRRREAGHDTCVIRLGVPGVIRGLDIDTRHFTGNYPPRAFVEACQDDADVPAESAWRPLTTMLDLGADAQHYVNIDSNHVFTHVRLSIFPDGGVARLRIYGEVRPDWSRVEAGARLDLLALENGGRALLCNDEHFGSMHNLNLPGRGINMGDGWETARRRTPGHDWVVLALGHAGLIEEIEIDTAYFKGNYPDRARLQAGRPTAQALADLEKASEDWPELLPASKLGPDAVHRFRDLRSSGPVTHVRLSIFPDGGVSRLRLYGYLEKNQ